MDYQILAEAYSKIEATTKRLDMTALLVELFRASPPEVLRKVVYLTQGKLYPDFIGVELGVADKLAIKALAFVTGLTEDEITARWMREGDLGLVAEGTIGAKKQRTLFSQPLTVERVYASFEAIARATGPGAQELKVKLMGDILHDASPLEAKFIVRTLVGKLRLGVADMTILDALSQAFAPVEGAEPPTAGGAPEPTAVKVSTGASQNSGHGTDEGVGLEAGEGTEGTMGEEAEVAARRKVNRAMVEHAYNLCSDLGEVAERLAARGLEGLREIRLEVGRPVRPMLAERLSSLQETLEKLGGKASLEYKYDGMRIQAHIKIGRDVRLFSRQLENVTGQFPDVTAAILEAFNSRDFEEAIVDGECVPVNIETGEMLPFQEVSHRRGRKYGLESAVEEYPVVYILFDCLQCDGIELISLPYPERRKKLQSIFRTTERVRISEALLTSDLGAAEAFFQGAIESGCEGIIAKSVREDSTYRAGARGWQWIKYKRDYKAEMEDTVDLVPVGAFAGHGKRRGRYGALLMAAYNRDLDRFETVCKLGTGFSDEFLEEMTRTLGALRCPNKHPRVESTMKADYWLVPSVVYEVLGAEITLSPVHTAGLDKIRKGAGLAIRFPRLKQPRPDKGPEDATTVQELIEMYERQLKRLE
ncbi:MAG: ATP-dependent DNA ligase [Thermoplasmata archaeon]